VKRAFAYEGRQLEVHAGQINGVWLVRVFENNAPTQSAQYQVEGPTELGADPTDLLENLMALVELDFRRTADRQKQLAGADIMNGEAIAGMFLAALANKEVTGD